MDIENIPQHNSKTYGGHNKIIYARQNGHYISATCNGWEDEEYATLQAVNALNAETKKAHELVKSGQKSPLYFYMYAYRHDTVSLAQCSGFFHWQVKRHLKPDIFNKLSLKKLNRYAKALNLSLSQLKTVPQTGYDTIN